MRHLLVLVLLALTPLLITPLVAGCDLQCRVATDQVFLNDYTNQLSISLGQLSVNMHGQLFQGIDLTALHVNPNTVQTKVLAEVDNAISTTSNRTLTDWSMVVDSALFDHYIGLCTGVVGEICGSPVSISYHIYDALNRTRGGLTVALRNETVVGGVYHVNLWHAAITSLQLILVPPPTPAQETLADFTFRVLYADVVAKLHNNLASILKNFRDGLEVGVFCNPPASCWDQWVPNLKTMLATVE